MTVGAGLVNVAVVTITHIVTHDTLFIFGAVMGAAYFFIAVAHSAAAASIIANRGAYQTANGSCCAATIAKLMAYSCAYQTTDDRTAK
jgi:hypothetical protein